MESNFWNWNWSYVCPTGLTPWQAEQKFLSPCFQQICLQLPMLFIFAIISAYFFGNQTVLIRRNKTQHFFISLRVLASFLIIILHFYSMYQMIVTEVPIYPIDVLLMGFQILTWSIHIGFLLVLRNHGNLSHRGPLFILVIWIALALLSGIWLRTAIYSKNWLNAAILVALHFVYLLSLMLKGNSTYIQRRTLQVDERQSLLGTHYVRFHDDMQIEALGQAQDEALCLSRLLFYWVNPLIEKGISGNLKTIDDLFDLPESMSINNTAECLQNALASTVSLFRALHRVFGFEFYAIGVLRFLADMLSFTGPLLMNSLLSQNSNDQTETNLLSYAYAFGLFSTTLIGAFLGTHFNWQMSIISLKMRMGLTTAIYRKALNAQFVNDNSPEVLNLMSTDTDRIVNSCISFHSFWSTPFQLFATLYLLYTQIGLAFVGGVIFAVILIPITRWLAIRISSLSQEFLNAKDARVSQTFEALSGAKQIKMLSWEDVFVERIQNMRQKELKALAKQKYLDALCVFFWAITPTIIKLLTFATAAVLGQTMTAATAFASVALLNMLIGPLNAFPWVFNGLVEAYVSLKRVQIYLDLPDIDLQKYYSPLEPQTPTEDESTKKPVIISMNNVSFCYNKPIQNGNDERRFLLNSISGDIKKGDLVCIEGPVGGGKSAFLNAINGSLSRISGYIHLQDIDEGMAYVAQQPWLQHGTMRENILFGQMFEEQRYRKVIWACALSKDIEDLGGDNIDIGENGSTLSGGQKARVALARAVYQEKQIYLIDDVLASLDAHVSKHIVKHCILGLLKDRTRIVVTENRSLFYYSNQILHVEEGVVTTSDFALGSFESDHLESESSSSSEFEINSSFSFELNTEDLISPEKSVFHEIKESGALSSRVLTAYGKAWGPTLGFFVLLSLFLMQASRNISDAWLAHWIKSINDSNSTVTQQNMLTESKSYTDTITSYLTCTFQQLLTLGDIDECTKENRENSTEEHIWAAQNSYYLAIYIGIAVFNSIIALIRAFTFAYAGIKAAKFIHNRLLNSVIFTEFSFFDITPVGRILNRFSSDINTIDDSLPFILNIFLAQIAGLIGALIVSLYGMPWLILVIVPMTPIYFDIQSRYRKSSRDIKRLSSNALSPIYTHFTETVQGLTTIRSMRAGNRFQRDFLVKLEDSTRSQLTASAAQQWLGLRLQMLGAFLIGGSGFIAVITSADSTTPELTGLVISYTLSFVTLLSGVLNALTETEQELIAVERVNNYSKLRPEMNAEGSRDAPFGWPCQGVVKFENVSFKYRPYLQPSLRNINFQTSSCERIGVVGRTGAGKSSLMAALLRVAPLHNGHITVDTVDIATLKLSVLRSRISLVPQNSFLFSGTIRDNLDPRGLHLDSDIWNSIQRCLATPLVQSLGGLNANLDVNGSNISAGQKQLLCLARALLRKSKVVIIDEGTSSLDSDSETAIQLILRNAFESSTVLLIAHRLNGLQQTDRLFVVENGQIIEEGNPQQLASDIDSRFHALLDEQQTTQMKPKII
ncbi:multidrug resistance-associated protein 7 [Contarinia nasturtii]|uniref:multidrug resistance-associated protein 7 n=1 Tax=Contarinia nasturtii TaxID=265458 RepID=UPI0012D3B39A|nr:multidrug resistance-associated protein 7 [Contarinia nasturtii]